MHRKGPKEKPQSAIQTADSLVVDSLLAVSLEVPAGRVAEMGNKGSYAGYDDGILVNELSFVVLLGDCVVAMHGHGSEGLAALWNVKAERQVVGAVGQQQAKRGNDGDAPLHRQMAMMGNVGGEVK
jgi:hypothetical protein